MEKKEQEEPKADHDFVNAFIKRLMNGEIDVTRQKALEELEKFKREGRWKVEKAYTLKDLEAAFNAGDTNYKDKYGDGKYGFQEWLKQYEAQPETQPKYLTVPEDEK